VQLRKRDGRVIGYEYDALNRLSIKYSPDGSVRYAYDLRGLQTAAWFTGTGWGVFNGYDGFGRLTSARTNMGGADRTLSSQYDPAGNRILLSGDSGYYAPFRYDGLGRMTAYTGVVSIGWPRTSSSPSPDVPGRDLRHRASTRTISASPTARIVSADSPVTATPSRGSARRPLTSTAPPRATR
jgi:YD repeat-containing protein